MKFFHTKRNRFWITQFYWQIAIQLISASVVPAVAESLRLTQQAETQLVILHTNDLHGHITSWRGWEGDLAGKTLGGLDRLSTAIESVRKKSEHVLLLDAGDAIADTVIGMQSKGLAVVELMNALGYDAMVLGNHEFDFGQNRLQVLMGKAYFPILAANIREQSGKLFAQPYIIRQLGPLRVGILGIAYPHTPLTTAKENVTGLLFEDPVNSAKYFIKEMCRQGAEVIIVLSHLGLGADIEFAKSVPGIDVIVGGHSHNRIVEPRRVGNTLIVQAGAHGSNLGVLKLTFSGNQQINSVYHLVTIDHAVFKAEPSMREKIDQLDAGVRTIADELIGKGRDWLIRAQTLAESEPRKRDQESPVDSLFADIIREAAGADVALLPGVGYGIAIPPGPITVEMLTNLIPHDSRIITMTMSGAELLEILEQSIENIYTSDSAKKVGGMIQVSGLTFIYNAEHAAGDRVLRTTVGGKQLDPKARYQVVTNSLLAQGGHSYRTFLSIPMKVDLGSQFEIIKSWFLSHPEITTPPLGRIHRQVKR
jgi:2',3'-cyclic-nucleotide 2'-phosphodiesterase (5'-nucleotidase family)